MWLKLRDDPNLERILIFEDDVNTLLDGSTVENHIRELYDHIRSQSMEEPDILYLGKAMDKCLDYKHVTGSVFHTTSPLCLHSYIISKKAVTKLLRHCPSSKAIDFIPIHAAKRNEVQLMTFHPSIFYQDILKNSSNLRAKKSQLSTTCECMPNWAELPTIIIAATFIIFIILLVAMIIYVLMKKR